MHTQAGAWQQNEHNDENRSRESVGGFLFCGGGNNQIEEKYWFRLRERYAFTKDRG
jgi:hypothetical protein